MPIARYLARNEFSKLAEIYADFGEPLPGDDAAVLVLEHEGAIVGFLAFHNITAIGLTYIAPEYRRNGATAMKLLGEVAEQSLRQAGQPLFVPIADDESPALAEQFGCVRIGSLYRKDFHL